MDVNRHDIDTSVRRGVVWILWAILAIARPVLAQTPLTLDEAMRRARGDTAEARALASTVDEAEARVRAARAGYWPRIDVAETVQRGNQPVFAFSSLLAQRRFAAENFAIAALNHPVPVTNTRTTIAVEQPILDGGLTRLSVQAASLTRAAAAAGRDAAGQDLAWRAAQTFVRVLQLEAIERAAAAAVSAADGDRLRARARRDMGLATEADALAVDVHLADMRQRQIAAGADLTVARIQLADAVGLPLDTVITPVVPEPRSAPNDGEAFVRESVAAHPLLRQADAQMQLAANAQRAARARLLPTLTAQGGWEFNGETPADQRSSWMAGAELRLNLFRGFADSARMAEAQHARTRASAERERVERRIEIDIRSALAQLAAARATEAAGRAALAQARESQRIIRDRYESGLSTIAEVLRASESTVAAESRATNAETDLILRAVELERALGRL